MKKYSLFLLIALFSCNGGKKAEVATEEIIPENIVEMRADQIKLANIVLGSFEQRSMSGTLKVNGVVAVAPNSQATVSAPMGGFIKSINLLPGRPVRKGQVLAVIENPEFIDLQQNYLETKSKFEYVEADYRRQSDLFKNDATSQKNLQQVTSEYQILKAQMRAMDQKLRLIGIQANRLSAENISTTTNVVSPISGFLKTVNGSIGKSVTSTDVLFELVNNDQLFLELTLFEKDANKVAIGQKLHFLINNETEEHEATLYQTAKSINADKYFKVYATVCGKCKNLLPGTYVNAIIEISGQKVTALPSEAVVNFEDKSYIFLFDQNKTEGGKPFTEYRMVEVHKGVSENDFVEVILPSDIDVKKVKVVVKGAYNLLSAKKNAGDMAC
ncbi:MAG TPA: efflux RND transporter periplasmic adaptor subunit [Bacteroidales bacterium]|nr:efflux RND transporter periplasmic adaptor subunit [Bacteroidales bacterium]